MEIGVALAPNLPSRRRYLNSRLAEVLLNSPSFGAWVQPMVQMVHPMWSSTEARAKVVEVNYRGSGEGKVKDFVTLLLKPAKWSRDFQAGQHILLTVHMSGALVSRTFSISSSPEHYVSTGLIELTIKRQVGGKVTPWLCDALAVGDWVQISQPKGEFTIHNSRKPVLLIAGGSGITPLKSMIESMATKPGSNVSLLYYARTDDHIFESQWPELGEKFERLSELEAQAHPDPVRGLDGMIHPTRAKLHYELIDADQRGTFCLEHLLESVPDYLDREVYVCGPIGMIKHVTQLLLDQGVPSHRIHFELFGAPLAETSSEVLGEASVTFSVSGLSVDKNADSGQTLLELAEASGINPRYGCRQGVCHECKCTKNSGVVFNRLTHTRSDTGKEEIQLCVSVPVGSVDVDI